MGTQFMRRSLLYIPGSSDKMLKKASSILADSIILDLEDSVSIAEKRTARERVMAYIPRIRKECQTEILVRVNGMDTLCGIEDLLEILPCHPDGVVIPKANEHAVILADGIISAVEAERNLPPNTIGMIPLFETAYSIANPLPILTSASRINGVQLGGEDLTKEQEITRTPPGEEIRYARHQVAMAGRACGLDIFDTPYTEIHDLEGVRRDAETAKQIGFTGKTCIHPSHIAVIHEVFSPSEEEVAFSRGVLEAYDAALAEGRGACMYQNKMVDAPVADRARKIIQKAQRIQQLAGQPS